MYEMGVQILHGKEKRGKERPVVKYSDSAVICPKTAEPIEIPFGIWTQVGPTNHVLDGAQDRHVRSSNF